MSCRCQRRLDCVAWFGGYALRSAVTVACGEVVELRMPGGVGLWRAAWASPLSLSLPPLPPGYKPCRVSNSQSSLSRPPGFVKGDKQVGASSDSYHLPSLPRPPFLPSNLPSNQTAETRELALLQFLVDTQMHTHTQNRITHAYTHTKRIHVSTHRLTCRNTHT